MALEMNPNPKGLPDEAELARWRTVPTTILGDELNRAQIMQAAIKPVTPNMGFAGPALTVRCMVGDNIALHHALVQAWPGCVLVVDARGHEDTAVWGGIMHESARARGVAAIVIDGAIRDIADIRQSAVSCFCRAAVPVGPHKGFGGAVNAPIQCGGTPVNPGDLVVGDEDGVVVVRPDQLPGLYERCQKRLAMEARVIEAVRAGKSTVELFSLPAPDKVGK